ncbi:MAG: MFS transporter [Candidatus Thermoplasmatota archaeon]|nr:MFS transporter [Candidatus Thermoplasmatota archaeon]MCL5730500.1 MFS transporter [Candidatus Thermoplasmatota archaeon]
MNRPGFGSLSFLQSLVIILSTTFAVRASNNMLVTSVPLLAHYDLGFTQAYIGILSAMTSLFTFLATALINIKLDSGARRKAYILSNVGYAAVLVAFSYSSFITVWILSGAAGFLLGMIMPNIITSASLFSDPVVRDRVLSLYTVFLSFSLIMGPAIEAYLLLFISLRNIFLVFSLFAVVSALLSPFLGFPDDRRDGHRIPVISSFGFRTALYNITAYNVPFAILIAFAGIYEKQSFGISLSTVTLLFSVFFTTSLASRIFLSLKVKGRLRVRMYVTMALSIAGIAIMLISRNVWMFAAALAVLGIPHGLAYPLSVLSISRSFKPEERNVANSVFFSIMMLIGIFVPLAGGYFIDLAGFKNVMFALVFVIAFLLLLTWRTFVAWDRNRNTELQT